MYPYNFVSTAIGMTTISHMITEIFFEIPYQIYFEISDTIYLICQNCIWQSLINFPKSNLAFSLIWNLSRPCHD